MADNVQSILDPVNAPKPVKAAAWDAYNAAQSPEDFRVRFSGIDIPKETKAALWDAKFSGASTGADSGRFALGATQLKEPETFLHSVGRSLLKNTLGAIPAVGAVAGGAIGLPLGPAGAAGGAGIGAGGGEALRQLLTRAIYGLDTGPQTGAEAAQNISAQSVMGTAGEAAGPATNKVLTGAGRAVSGVFRNPNTAERAAVTFGQSQGIPVDAATASGNRFVAGAQKVSEHTPAGALIAESEKAKSGEAMMDTGKRIAASLSPAGATPESAGAAVRSSIENSISKLKQTADAAYDAFRTMEADPKNVRTVQVGTKTVQSNIPGPNGQPAPPVTVPVTKDIALPVDMKPVKKLLAPIYADMAKWMQPARQQASAGLQAMKSILEGDDFIPASQAEKGLSGLKSLAREAASPDLANVSQGVGKLSTSSLQAQIDAAVAKAGPAEVSTLRGARFVHASKMQAADVLDTLRQEPVQTFNQATMAKDAGIDRLREIARVAPDSMPKVGRAFLDDMLTKAGSQGGFSGADGMFAKWQNLGPETKKLLYPDAAMRGNLDKFFLLGKMMARNPNPSGTAYVTMIVGQAGFLATAPLYVAGVWVSGGVAAKLFHSPVTVKLLTEGLQTPINSPGAASLTKALVRVIQQQKGTEDTQSQ